MTAPPRTRGECPVERPCQHTGCRYHLPTACALDVADEGAHTLAEVADLLGISRERVRQIEATACRRLAVLHGRSTLVDILSRDDATGYDLPPDPGA